MGFKDFRFKVAIRVVLVGVTMAGVAWSINDPNMIVTTVLFGLVSISQLLELYRFIARTNRKLTLFLESIKYSDFISGFSADNQLGSSFKDLNIAFNEVLEAFRKARSEKEEHLQYLNTIVEHVSTGLISYDTEGQVQLINATAKRFLKVDTLRNIDELIESQSRLYKVLFDLPTGKSTLHRIEGDIQLSVHATDIILRGTQIKLVALQNIQPELQKKELEAWQNLTRVLRHEIMNSITPIASLTSTMKDILIEDLTEKQGQYELPEEAVEDLQEGLGTIEGRSQGLIRFIDAYRDYTSIPLPKIGKVAVKQLLEYTMRLMKVELRKSNVTISINVKPESLMVNVDEELIEQVLINLVKNAVEAFEPDHPAPEINLTADVDRLDNPQIKVRDNGKGIIREALDQIFIPFYSTKSKGSGIGLSLSRQIMQLHNGTLTVESESGEFTVFTMTF
ncbi:GHKL domain-containing protein [Fulvivirga sp. M361]|uniref:sensor histidine kinase n=1 Tax=Fulvivirga sp. M361 TaxID=2594266 RepID=UPI001179947B|nr:ATP-binding protein [Fulvivirga sp. M361]TRX62112.1 GHKL domain-containing protein [Fulvivirga sp. M361]